MDQKLSDLPVEVRRQLVNTALDLTRLRKKARRAVLLVIVDDKRQVDAAKELRCAKQFVNTALRIVRPKLKEVEDYFKSLGRE
jgi:DNA-directed RNA polymerase specialized sigma24 family protein